MNNTQLPFEYDEYPFEFDPELDEQAYFKFGFKPGEVIDAAPFRMPGEYTGRSRFFQDTSRQDCRIQREMLEAERANISGLKRKWSAYLALAQKELLRAKKFYDVEQAVLYLTASRSQEVLKAEYGKITEGIKEAWVKKQDSYLELRAWRDNAEAQYEYIRNCCYNLNTKADMVVSLANDDRVEQRHTYTERE